MTEDSAAGALRAASRALGRRDLSTAALDERLRRAGFSAEARAEAIARLVEAGYLDDERFALERACRLAERGAGDEAIRHDLQDKSVELELVDRALASLEPESERAVRIAARLGGGVRAARALARKGFAADSIESALTGAIAEEPRPALGLERAIRHFACIDDISESDTTERTRPGHDENTAERSEEGHESAVS